MTFDRIILQIKKFGVILNTIPTCFLSRRPSASGGAKFSVLCKISVYQLSTRPRLRIGVKQPSHTTRFVKPVLLLSVCIFADFCLWQGANNHIIISEKNRCN